MAFDEVTSTPRWAPESHYAKEMAKWNKPRSQGGMRPDGFEPFPKMLYRARRPDSGGPILCVDPRNEQWSTANQHTVGNEAELERAMREGWRKSPQEAIAYAQGLEDDIANAAAHRAYEDRNMGEKAKAEAQAADEATAEHLPEIQEAPRRRGRPRKIA